MSEERKIVDVSRCDELAREIQELRAKIEALLGRVETLEAHKEQFTIANHPLPEKAAAKKEGPVERLPDEIGWSQISQELLLPRIAAVCFMLVFALILRTITDNGMIDRQLGSYLGTVYAITLIGWGWHLYRNAHRLAPVFPACGVLLLYSIIYETHVHFESLSGTTVYSILLIAEMAVLFIGLKCRAVVLLFFATFGSTFVGTAIGFPTPLFALLGVVLILNNVAAYVAARRAITTSLQWYTLIFSIVYWLLWASKLNYALRFGEGAQQIGLFWSIPVLVLFYAFFMYTSIEQLRKDGKGIGFFHYFLPTVNAVGAFMVVYFILHPWLGYKTPLGVGAVVFSSLYIGLVGWLSKKDSFELHGGKGLVVAATVLLILGLAIAVPVVWALPIWAAAALSLTLYSRKWESGGVRVISYLFQLFIVFYAHKMRAYDVGHSAVGAGFLAAIILAICCLWLYRWCRMNVPEYDSIFFQDIDTKDNSAIILLIVGLVHAFYATNFATHTILSLILSDPGIAIFCAKSIIINLGAVFLMILGIKGRSREILRVSGIVVVLGGFKVFIFDMFKAHGVPLVLSVFSLGIVAVAGSMTIKRWQQSQEGLKKEKSSLA